MCEKKQLINEWKSFFTCNSREDNENPMHYVDREKVEENDIFDNILIITNNEL